MTQCGGQKPCGDTSGRGQCGEVGWQATHRAGAEGERPAVGSAVSVCPTWKGTTLPLARNNLHILSRVYVLNALKVTAFS